MTTTLEWKSIDPFTVNIDEGHAIIFKDLYCILTEDEKQILVNTTTWMGRKYYRPMGNKNELITRKLNDNPIIALFENRKIVLIRLLIFPDTPGLY